MVLSPLRGLAGRCPPDTPGSRPGLSSNAPSGLLNEVHLVWFGPPIRRFIESNLPLLAGLFFVLLFGGFVAVRYLL